MKRGMSAIVTTVIMVALVLVAIGVVWAVISNLVGESTEDIDASNLDLNLEIKSVYFNGDDSSLTVKVYRGVGRGEISGLKFVINTGNGTIESEQESLNELEEKTFTLDYSGPVEDISIVPIVGEKEIFTSPIKTFEESRETYDVISNKNCGELGGSSNSGGDAECGMTPEVCSGACHNKTWVEARDVCENYGARLCTLEEIQLGAAEGSGGGIDNEMIWTSTECGFKGFYLIRGEQPGHESESYCEEDLLINIPTQLWPGIDQEIGVRCCGDTL